MTTILALMQAAAVARHRAAEADAAFLAGDDAAAAAMDAAHDAANDLECRVAFGRAKDKSDVLARAVALFGMADRRAPELPDSQTYLAELRRQSARAAAYMGGADLDELCGPGVRSRIEHTATFDSHPDMT